MRPVASVLALTGSLSLVACGLPESADAPAEPAALSVVGRWDVTVEDQAGAHPAWFEIREDGDGLAGSFVGRVGSARPIADLGFENGALRFSLPPQYEDQEDDLVFVGRVEGHTIAGRTVDEEGQGVAFVARRAPDMDRTVPVWGEPIDLLASGREGWRLRDETGPDGWTMAGDELVNTPPSLDLLTERSFADFKLALQFLMPKGSNSGVYLRGRHELQIQDDHGKQPDSLLCGGIYGFLTPSTMACRAAGEWNELEVTLVGRRLTAVLNGETIHDGVEIPGITGGALDSAEGEPGPLMLQGDHEAVRYRGIVITPALETDDATRGTP